jgi:dolichol-phosphate mannosyltransferase
VRIFVTLPTYNESGNIKRLIDSLLSIGKDYSVVVIDDDSPDGTWKIVKEISVVEPRVHLIHRTSDPGRGRSGAEGFRYALDHGADIIVEMDADFSHDPKFVPSLVEATARYDLVLGSRLVSGGSDEERSRIRTFLTWFSTSYARLLLGVPVADVNSGFRCYRRSVIEALNPDTIRSRGPAIVQEVLFRVHRLGFSIGEVPISFKERAAGESNLTTGRLAAGFFTVLKLASQRIRRKV